MPPINMFAAACPKHRVHRVLLIVITLLLLAACAGQTPASSTVSPPQAQPKELVFYNWADDMPQSMIDAFTKESGIAVKYETYDDQQESIANIMAGKPYDVAVVANEHVPTLVSAQKLAAIDFRNVPNFKNISANFRDLAYDQGNQHTVPYHWGTVGLIVRDDLVGGQVKKWSDLWNPRYAGKIGIREITRDVVGFTLVSLGYSFNSEKPEELEAAAQKLLELKPSLVFVDVSADSVVPKLISGELEILVGWAEDALDAQEQNPQVQYVLPQEGAILWGDNFAIPASSANKAAAEQFINFMLRPEISAKVVNEKRYATPNEAATAFVAEDLRSNKVIFPPNERVSNAHLMMPLSPEGEKLYESVWQRFMAAGQ